MRFFKINYSSKRPLIRLLSQDPDYVNDTPSTSKKPAKKYCTMSLKENMDSVARFNRGYGEASVSTTLNAKDFGHSERITKSKIRSQLKKACKAEIGRLKGTSLRGIL